MLNNPLYNYTGFGAPFWLPVVGAILVVVLIWSFFWKGLALWHSAQHKQPVWFIAFLFLNTLGILEIVYLFAILKLNFSKLFKK